MKQKKKPPKLRNSLAVKTVIFLSSFLSSEKYRVSCTAKWFFSSVLMRGERVMGFDAYFCSCSSALTSTLVIFTFAFFLLSWNSPSEMKYLAGTGNEHGCVD